MNILCWFHHKWETIKRKTWIHPSPVVSDCVITLRQCSRCKKEKGIAICRETQLSGMYEITIHVDWVKQQFDESTVKYDKN
jgi:hypothetical protein